MGWTLVLVMTTSHLLTSFDSEEVGGHFVFHMTGISHVARETEAGLAFDG